MDSSFLTIRNEPIIIFNIQSFKSNYKNLEKYFLRINGEWMDIQKLNYILHYIIGQIITEGRLKSDVFRNLDVLLKDFYIHFSIIYKLLEKINKEIKNKEIQKIFTQFKKEFKYKIQILRNKVIIHQEKIDFRDTKVVLFYTSSDDIVFLKLFTKKGNFELRPFRDAKKIENYLFKLKEVLEK